MKTIKTAYGLVKIDDSDPDFLLMVIDGKKNIIDYNAIQSIIDIMSSIVSNHQHR